VVKPVYISLINPNVACVNSESVRSEDLNDAQDFSLLGSDAVWTHTWVSRDSSFGIATGKGLDNRGVGVRVPVG
jgi:hypothetical protein